MKYFVQLGASESEARVFGDEDHSTNLRTILDLIFIHDSATGKHTIEWNNGRIKDAEGAIAKILDEVEERKKHSNDDIVPNPYMFYIILQ